jgi:hypothetical protein
MNHLFHLKYPLTFLLPGTTSGHTVAVLYGATVLTVLP